MKTKQVEPSKKIIVKTRAEIQALVNDAWRDGYSRGTADCAADYECGLRKVSPKGQN